MPTHAKVIEIEERARLEAARHAGVEVLGYVAERQLDGVGGDELRDGAEAEGDEEQAPRFRERAVDATDGDEPRERHEERQENTGRGEAEAHREWAPP